MADTKITALAAITTVAPANDLLPIVDVSDNSMAASGTTKNITINQILGAGGTATLASATISGDLTVDTNVLKVDTTNNRVGIGTASPSGILHAANLGTAGTTADNFNGYFSSANRNANLYLLAKNTEGSNFYFGDGDSNTVGGIIYDHASNYMRFDVNGIEQYRIAPLGVNTWSDGAGGTRMTLNANGLGIGVTPSAWATYKALQVGQVGSFWANPSGADVYVSANQYFGSGADRYIANGAATSYKQLSGAHAWLTAPSGTAGNTATFTQAMTLDASGNLLVGVTSASNQERLNVSSAVSLYVARVFNTASSGGNYGIAIRYSNAAPNNGANEFLACSDNAASRAFIYSNGGIANYQANDSNLSDARTKTDIKPLASYWNKIKALELVTFKYKDQTHDDDNIGLIAQQVESVAPEFVSNEGFGEIPADGVQLKTIYTTDLYHAAIKALQEAMTRIEALESKLA